MKVTEEPDKSAYDLRPIELYYDDDQELISSLVIIDTPRAAQEFGVNKYPELKGIPNLKIIILFCGSVYVIGHRKM